MRYINLYVLLTYLLNVSFIQLQHKPKKPTESSAYAAWARDHVYSRRGIFGGSVVQLYRKTYVIYAVRSAQS